jgi:hypothetical protein
MSEATTKLHDLILGAWGTQALYVAARLRLADLLASGLRSSDEIARELGVDRESIYRVMRYLSGLGVFAQAGEDSFALAELGNLMRSGVQDSARGMALWYGEVLWPAWGALFEAVKTGQQGFEIAASRGAARASDPETAAALNEFMAEATAREASAIIDAYDFSRFGTIMDVGGGFGALMTAILKRHRAARGIVFDQSSAREGAIHYIKSVGVEDRCEFVVGDFFKEVPSGADALILKHITHNWDDDRSQAVLRNCQRAKRPDVPILIMDMIAPEAMGNSRADCAAARMDLTMMLGGGRERTELQLRTLVEGAELAVARIVPTSAMISIVEVC